MFLPYSDNPQNPSFGCTERRKCPPYIDVSTGISPICINRDLGCLGADRKKISSKCTWRAHDLVNLVMSHIKKSLGLEADLQPSKREWKRLVYVV